MSKRLTRTLAALALGMGTLATSASATVYVNKRYCGGGGFATCAAVMLDVTGTTVTLRLWNLGGNTANSFGVASDPAGVFQGIGLYNVPTGVDVVGGLSTTGPARAGDSPTGWVLRQNKHIGFLIDFGAVSGSPPTNDNGIASGCNPAALPSGVDLFLNPCTDPSSAPLSDWVTFTFQVNQTWDASNAGISLRAVDAAGNISECATTDHPLGASANCFQVAPEPVTMLLLATGLVGLGGVGVIRRRRANKA